MPEIHPELESVRPLDPAKAVRDIALIVPVIGVRRRPDPGVGRQAAELNRHSRLIREIGRRRLGKTGRINRAQAATVAERIHAPHQRRMGEIEPQIVALRVTEGRGPTGCIESLPSSKLVLITLLSSAKLEGECA